MPFANKFRAMMAFPFPGEAVGDFIVESVDVRDVPGDFGHYGYAVRMVLRGPGGQQGVRRALRPLLSARPQTFSGYGNPYQLWCGRPEIESLGDKRYAVTARGAGAAIDLEAALVRFADYLAAAGLLAGAPEDVDPAQVVAAYLDGYRAEIQRHVARYRGKVRRMEGD